MAADMIRCPGCGVKMDLSSFAVRPSQVICPRCDTRSIVPPAAPQVAAYEPDPTIRPDASFGQHTGPLADQIGGLPSEEEPKAPSVFDMLSFPVEHIEVQPASSGRQEPPVRFDIRDAEERRAEIGQPVAGQPVQQPAGPEAQPVPQLQVTEVTSQAQPEMTEVTSQAQPEATEVMQAVEVTGAMPASGAAGTIPVMESTEAMQAVDPTGEMPVVSARAEAMQAEARAERGGAAEDPQKKRGVLPIDKKGNTEPLAFSILGLLSTLLLFPPIGLSLCIAALLMNRNARRRKLVCYRKGLTAFIAVIGIILNTVLLIAEAAFCVMYFASPASLYGLPW